jgi:hypothetical protein
MTGAVFFMMIVFDMIGTIANQGDRSLIFLEPKHGCGSPPRCHILLVVAKEPLLMDKNPGYPWVFGEIVVSLAG